MAQKKKGKEQETPNDKWNKEEDPLQAVVIADSFNTRFLPITLQKPRALLPIVNWVLLDFTIEYLIEEGVQEIILFCCANANLIKKHASTAKWAQNTAQCPIQIVTSSSEDCISFGDAIREIDRGGFIRSDFLLVPGDLVSNVKLGDIIQQHKTRRKKEKDSVMTMLFKTAKPGHFSRCLEEDIFVAIDPKTNRILHCQQSHDSKKFSVPAGLLSSRESIQIRYDFADCHIAICAPTVMPLFTDNFDYQSKEDFVRGILINEEIMGNQIHCHIIEDEYASRVSDLHMYNAISLDLMNRWAYPLVPDNGSYQYSRNNIYLDKHVKLARDCSLEQDVVIGQNSVIGNGTYICKTVIGENCQIGENVRITNSFVWNDAHIGDNCVIDHSIVCDGCVIKRNVCMDDAIVSFKVKLGPDLAVPKGAKFSLIKPEQLNFLLSNFEDLTLDTKNGPNAFDSEHVGQEGCGYLLRSVEEDDDEEAVIGLRGRELESDSESSDDESIATPAGSPTDEAGTMFYLEVLESVRSGIFDNVASDNIILEVNASKYKYNVSIREINQAVVRSILETAMDDHEKPRQALVQSLDKIVLGFMPLIANYIKGNESQMDCITAAEDFFAENSSLGGIFPTLLHKLYDRDILDESTLLKWFHTSPSPEDPDLLAGCKQLRNNELMKRFMTWLEEAEEESDEEESD
eukprot:gene12839-14159_t